MKQDVFGQMNSLTRADSAEAWDGVLLGFLAHAAVTPEHLGKVLTLEPDFALGHAVKGMFLSLLGRRELMATAAEALTLAEDAARHGSITLREQKYVEALRLWLNGNQTGAVQTFETVLRDHPDDTLAMKLSHACRFVLGDSQGMRRSIERVMPAYAPDHAGRGYLLGCHAFSLEETGAYEKAEIAGRQALWMVSDDAWGLHAVAHVHDMTGNAKTGLEWLSGREAAWAHCNNFRYHVWWHKALMHLDLGQVDRVMELYDAEIRKDRTDDYRDISNATSLLMRLELEGVDVGDRWDELANLSASRTEDGCLIFADLHYLLALTGSDHGEAGARMLARIHADAKRSDCDVSRRMADPGVAAANGLCAFGEGRYGEAFDNLLMARDKMHLAGGSHAQRDVFERLTIDSGLRAGRLDAVELILDDRQAKRAGGEDNYALARRALIAAGRGGADAQSVPAE
ncbi:tetratricopeptide repeat protein [Ruegeria sp. 2205SS24-7]|uniref:tetratricopeptide repeat protein n=1 Tax=Ruegeria discodermiae TaxID=3064389 RepID=UPI0027406C56|nr:tetratricopeptide repeat protein [Ruegeria sp. 2205SS24-7]MDP5216918.1 tetratricopeptide repeat protein [Ruegeria sp. 2205SS24-7]